MNVLDSYYRIRRCPVPPLSSPPVKLEESWSLKKFSTKFFLTMPSNLLWTRFSYFYLFFLFKYDEIIIK